MSETAPNRPGPRRSPGDPVGPEAVRRAVLDAAAALFVARGVPRVTIREIARTANVHPTLVGRYVGRREQLIDATYLDLTEQLVAEIDAGPLRARSFERDSVMGAWTVMLAHYAANGEDTPSVARNPVTAIADAIKTHYGADRPTALWRASQIVGSAFGWRLIESPLIEMGSLDRTEIPAIRADLNLLHNIVGSLALPTVDPRPASER